MTSPMQFAVIVALCAATVRADAQIAPDTPRLISPHGSGGLGFFVLGGRTLPGDDEAFLATWAMPGLPRGLRMRGGVGRGADGENAVFGGLDFQSPLMRRDRELNFDLDWQTGLGGSVGDYVALTVPLGLSGGVSMTSGTFWLAPYVTAGIAADLRLGDERPDREFEVSPTLDVGADFAVDRNRRLVFRAATSLGDRQAWSLGFALGLGRVAPVAPPAAGALRRE